MLAAEDVLNLCSLVPGGCRESDAYPEFVCVLGETPSPTGTVPLKRQRLLESSCTSHSSASSQQSQWVAPAQSPTLRHAGQAAAPSPASAAAAAAAAAAPQASIVPWQASFLLDYVRRCLEALNALHPVTTFIQTETKAAEMACAIFRRAYLQRGIHEQAALLSERFLAQALLAASLWVAVKWEATRTTTPDSTLMCRITGIPAAFLRQQEREILASLNWDLMDVAREVGAVGVFDGSEAFTDVVCRHQQAQLARLTQPLPGMHSMAAVMALQHAAARCAAAAPAPGNLLAQPAAAAAAGLASGAHPGPASQGANPSMWPCSI